MPPFVNTNCSHEKCRKPNRFDLAELRKSNGGIYKAYIIRGEDSDEEFEVTCKICGRKFKILVKGADDGKKE